MRVTWIGLSIILATLCACGVAVPAAPGAQDDSRHLAAFRNCMSHNGVETNDLGIALDQSSLAYQNAIRACAKLIPVIRNPPVPQQEIDRMLRWSRCMRANGADVPDPQLRGGLAAVEVPVNVSASQRFRDAEARCRPIITFQEATPRSS